MATTKVILMENVSKLGTKYSIKDVAAGYARNFLIPTGKAMLATESSLAKVEEMQARANKEKQIQYDLLKKESDKIESLVVNIVAKANEEGHLYGSVHVEDIAEVLSKDHGINLDSTWIKLPKNMKEVGEYEVKVEPKLEEGSRDNVSLTLKVNIEAA